MSPIKSIFKVMLYMDISSKNTMTMSTLIIAVFSVSSTGVKSFLYKRLDSKCFKLNGP